MAQASIAIMEERPNLANIASTVFSTRQSVAVYRDSKPWVVISPAQEGRSDDFDKASQIVIPANPLTGITTLPEDWDCPEDDGLYDDLV